MAGLSLVLCLITTSPAVGAAGEVAQWTLDPAYADRGLARLDGVSNSGLVIDPDGRAYMLVERDSEPGVVSLVRYTEGGELDRSFGDGGFAVVPPNELSHLVLELQNTDSGPRLVVGEWGFETEPARFYRFRMNGALDPAFGAGGMAAVDTGPMWMEVRDLATGPDHSIYAAGNCTKTGIHQQPCIVSLTADGAPNSAFADDGFKVWLGDGTRDAFITSVGVAADGSRLFVGGRDDRPKTRWLIGAFDPRGRADKSFGADGAVTLRVGCPYARRALTRLHVETTGAVIATGRTCNRTAFARVTIDGALDPTFGKRGWTRLPDGYSTMSSTYDPATRSVFWVHGARDGDLHVGAVLPDGSPDPAFGADSELDIDLEPGSESFFWNLGVALDGQGRLYASAWYPAGDFEGVVLARAVQDDER